MDFEFLEKRPQPRYSFIMKIYNKENTTSEQMPYLYFQCTSKEQFFAMTHILERQLPARWQAFFEDKLAISAMSQDCYQYHCFMIKKNAYGQL